MVVLGLVSADGARAEIIWSDGVSAVIRTPAGVIQYQNASSPWVPKIGAIDGGSLISSNKQVTLRGAQPITLIGQRAISRSAIAATAVSALKLAGPYAALGLTLAPLLWNEVNKLWEAPGEADPYEDVGNGSDGLYFGYCGYQAPVGTIRRYAVPATYENLAWVSSSEFPLPGGREAWPTSLNNCRCQDYPNLGCPAGKWAGIFRRAVSGSCPAGESRTYEGTCAAPETIPATDEQIEEAVLRDLPYPDASPVVGWLRELPFPMEGGGTTVSGPGTVSGGTSSSTTTGPAGQTVTNTTTNYELNYNGDTVTVTATTTTTTTDPAGATTTTTTTEGGTETASGPEEPPVDVCVEHPEASGCQPLGSVDTVDVGAQVHTLTWTAEGSAAGSCPAPMPFSLPFGGTEELSWAPVCQFATGIRPVVIAVAWLSAGIFIFQVARG